MIKVLLTNEMLRYISHIEINRYRASQITLPLSLTNRLRKNSRKKSSYASNRIEGNPLSQAQVDEVIDGDESRHYLGPEQEVRNYFLALKYLESKAEAKERLSRDLILEVQRYVVMGESEEKVGLRGPMPPGMLFAVYDSESGRPEYIPPEYSEVPSLLDELIDYVNTTDDHPLIVSAVVHYQLVTIHPFEDGNGRTARLLSGYILDINGFGFNGIGSLEEYFAYDIDEYYQSLQMGLPALYYSGRDNPPHPERWIMYFLRMLLLYSTRVCELTENILVDEVEIGLSHLKSREKELLLVLLDRKAEEFTPIGLSLELGVSNRTVINRLSALVKSGFATPNIVNERIRSYSLSSFTKEHLKELKKMLRRT